MLITSDHVSTIARQVLPLLDLAKSDLQLSGSAIHTECTIEDVDLFVANSMFQNLCIYPTGIYRIFSSFAHLCIPARKTDPLCGLVPVQAFKVLLETLLIRDM